jgi:hypothetical protein
LASWTAAAFTATPAVWLTVSWVGGDSKALCITMSHIRIGAVTTALNLHVKTNIGGSGDLLPLWPPLITMPPDKDRKTLRHEVTDRSHVAIIALSGNK